MSREHVREDEHVVHGSWWVPGAAASKVAGVLRYGSCRGIRLELAADPLPDLARDRVAQIRRWHDAPSVILGHSDDKRELFTIVDALAVSIGPSLEFFANHVLRGRGIGNVQRATFAWMMFELEHLEAWAGGPMLADAIPEGTTAAVPTTLLEFKTKNGSYEITVQAFPFFRARESGNFYSCTVQAKMFNPIALPGVIAELEKFLALMTIFIGVHVKPRGLFVSLTPDAPRMELILSWTPSTTKDVSPHDMLVPFGHLGEAASAIFSNWFANWTLLYQSAAMFLTACSTTYTIVRVLSLVSGLEAFHRATQLGQYLPDQEFDRWREKLVAELPAEMLAELRDKLKRLYEFANEFSLRQRLKQLLRTDLKSWKPQDNSMSRNSFVELVVDVKNRLTHGTGYVEVGADLFRVANDLTRILLRLLLMRVGCTESVISSAETRLPRSGLVSASTE
jgi:hypothetical protein